MAFALKKQRKRAARKAHAKFVKDRNKQQGHTGGPNSRGPKKPVGAALPSFHKKKRQEVTITERWGACHQYKDETVLLAQAQIRKIMTADEFEQIKADAKKRKKSFAKVAEAAGWEMNGEDKTDHHSWTKEA